MTRLYGWAPKGERLIDKVPHSHWETATFLAALRSDRIDAPCLFDGPINGERFRAYVEQFLVPTLKAGDVVILDNLGSHKGKAVRKAIRDVGARLVFLPKYSPDLNPIEQLFAKFKTLLRKVGARTYEAISAACAKSSNAFPQANAPPTSETQAMRKTKSKPLCRPGGPASIAWASGRTPDAQVRPALAKSEEGRRERCVGPNCARTLTSA